LLNNKIRTENQYGFRKGSATENAIFKLINEILNNPLLFLIYVNDLPKVVEPTAIPNMFADDTSILMKSYNNIQLQCKLNIVMSRINKWFQDNLITLNLEKTYFIQFSNKSPNNLDIRINIDKKNIATVDEIKFL